MNGKRLYRSSVDRKLLGVCGGVADYLNTDPTIVRLIWVLMFFAFGVGLLAYLVAALIIPPSPI